LKNKVAIISAIEEHELGCPLFVTLMEFIESILNKLAISSTRL
jgi:hypothetical protein